MTDVFKSRWYAIEPVGVLKLSGPDGPDLLHRLSTQALRELGQDYQVRSTIFTTAQGKMVDWALVLHSGEDVLIQTHVSRAARLRDWIDNYIIMDDASIEDVSSQWTRCVVQGDGAFDFLGGEVLRDKVLVRGEGYWFKGLEAFGERVAGLVPVLAAGALGEELGNVGFVEAVERQWEYLRILAGVPSPDWEYTKEINPLELRLKEEAIAWNKGCYIGQEVISRLDSYDKVKRLLMGFSSKEEIEGEESVKLSWNGKTVGKMTSCVPGPDGGTVGLAIVERDGLDKDVISIETAGRVLEGRLENRPFWAT